LSVYLVLHAYGNGNQFDSHFLGEPVLVCQWPVSCDW